MKHILIISILTLISCGQNQQQNNLSVKENLSKPGEIAPTEVNKKDISTKSEKAGFYFEDSSFEMFYEKFKSDSLFQMNRIKFPIKGNYRSYDQERNWSKENWIQMDWDLRTELNNPDDSVSIIQDNHKFFFGTYCRDCGFSFEMEFEKTDNEWFLTYRQENNF